MTVVIPFSGADGWAEGLPDGTPTVGIELDRWATLTATAAGHPAIRADVETFPTRHITDATGLIASPPCQAFSTAGRGEGRALADQLTAAAAEGALRPDLPAKARLVLEPTRWIRDLRPEWIAMEQVPPVLPIWQAYAHWLRGLGYDAWAGVLNAADYGVPQTRRRAILIASRVRRVACPAPTHAQTPGLWAAEPWISMADALHLDPDLAPMLALDRRTNSRGAGGTTVRTAVVATDRPSPTVTSAAGAKGQWVWRLTATGYGTGDRSIGRPSPTVTGHAVKSHSWRWTDGHLTLPFTQGQATVLQSFRPDYPWQGPKHSRSLQVGNAMPPLLAAHVHAAATGHPLEAAA